MTMFYKYFSKYYTETSIWLRLKNSVFWSLVGSLVYNGMMILASFPTARILGAENYGKLGIIQSTLTTFVFLSGFAVAETAIKYISEYRNIDLKRVEKILGLIFFSCFIISIKLGIIIYILAPYFSKYILNSPQMEIYLKIMIAAILLNSISSVQIGILSGLEQFSIVAMINILKGILSFLFITFGAFLKNLIGAVIGLVISSLVLVLISQIILKNILKNQKIAINFSSFFTERRILFSYYLPSIIGGISTFSVIWIGNILLVNSPGGYVEMGIFNVANQWRMVVQFLPNIIAYPNLSILSNLYGRRNFDQYKQALDIYLLFSFLLSIVPALVVTTFSKWIMQMYGVEFLKGDKPFVILVLASTFYSVSSAFGISISSLDKLWYGMLINILWAIIFLILCSQLVKYGVYGLAFTYLIAYLVSMFISGIINFLLLKKLINTYNAKAS